MSKQMKLSVVIEIIMAAQGCGWLAAKEWFTKNMLNGEKKWAEELFAELEDGYDSDFSFAQLPRQHANALRDALTFRNMMDE